MNNLGWLSPAGIFYTCDYFGHYTLADQICSKRGYNGYDPQTSLEQRGWIKLTLKGGLPEAYIWINDASKPVSQKQWDFIFDWCDTKGIEFPPEYMEFQWEDSEYEL